jgi:hypothetical protein
MSHLSPETLVDIAEGAAPESSAPHLATCTSCRAQLADLRAMIATAAVDVPEPSPLFWEHFSARVREATAAEATRRSSWWRSPRLSWRLAAVMSVAVVVVAVSMTIRTTSPPAKTVTPVVTQSTAGGADLASATDDPSLSLLADLAGDLDWDAAAEAGMAMEVGTADGALMDLTEVERAELQRLLREAMSGSGV